MSRSNVGGFRNCWFGSRMDQEISGGSHSADTELGSAEFRLTTRIGIWSTSCPAIHGRIV